MWVPLGLGDVEAVPVKYEAQRRKHLQGEVVKWAIIDEDLEKEVDKVHDRRDAFPVYGEWDYGRVLVQNRHGAMWTMSVEDFDAEYLAR